MDLAQGSAVSGILRYFREAAFEERSDSFVPVSGRSIVGRNPGGIGQEAVV